MQYTAMQVKEKEEDRQSIINYFKNLNKDQIIKYIEDNLYFDEDYCVNDWKIYIDFII